MTALSRDNIPSTITTLEGLMAWAMLTYEAAYGGKSYAERDLTDTQAFANTSISAVKSLENGSDTFLVGRIAVPVQNTILAGTQPAWLATVEHSQQVSLPGGYTV